MAGPSIAFAGEGRHTSIEGTAIEVPETMTTIGVGAFHLFLTNRDRDQGHGPVGSMGVEILKAVIPVKMLREVVAVCCH